MPFTYSSDFWRQRALDMNALALQMNAADARAAMLKTAWTYQFIHLRCAHHEAKIAFDRARNALLKGPFAPTEREKHAQTLQERRDAVDDARLALDNHRKTVTDQVVLCVKALPHH